MISVRNAVLWLPLIAVGLFSVNTQAKVQLGVYYESLCPDSDSFFHQQLWPTFQKLSSDLAVELVPYGNAHSKGKVDEYTFTCQHGPDECYGNIVQNCFVELVNSTETSIKFINCAFDTRKQRKVMEKCIGDADLRRQVKKCVTSPMGRNLLYYMGKKTDDLSPAHSFIPWITVNGRGGSSLNEKANDDLFSVICDELADEKPDVCKKFKRDAFRTFRENYL